MHIYTGNHPWLAPGSPMAQYVLGNVYGHELYRSKSATALAKRRSRVTQAAAGSQP
jgi:hypothetical protein